MPTSRSRSPSEHKARERSRRVVVDNSALEQINQTLQDIRSDLRNLQDELRKLQQERQADKARISAIAAENAWLRTVVETQVRHSRQARITPIERNVIIFPVKQPDGTIPSAFKTAVATGESINTALGIPRSETSVIVQRGPSDAWVKVTLPSTARKFQVLKYAARSATRAQHHVVIKEELLPDEQAERAYLQKVMTFMYEKGMRPSWRRGSISWWENDRQGTLTVFDIPDGLSEEALLAKCREKIQLAAPRSRAMDTRPDHNPHQVPPPNLVQASSDTPTGRVLGSN